MFGILASALAAPPFEVGSLQPLPAEPTGLAIHRGTLYLLGADGLWSHGPDGWTALDEPGGAALLARGDTLLRCGPDGVHAVGGEALSTVPCHDLAAVGDGVWLLAEDVVLRLEDGSSVPLPQRPDLLGGGPERAWLAGNQLYLDDRARLVFPGTTDLARVRIDDPAWLLLHPERRLLGLLGPMGLESAWTLPFSASHIAVGDLDGDGTEAIIIAGDHTWARVHPTERPTVPASPPPSPLAPTAAPPAPTSAPTRRWEPPPSTRMLGFDMPNFAGLPPDPEYDTLFIGGFGLALGGGTGTTSSLVTGFSPAVAGGVERGHHRLRSYFGLDAAPLFIWMDTEGGTLRNGIHLGMATAGFSIGSDRLRAGPFVSGGLLGVATGTRLVFTPFTSHAGKLTGFEARLTWFYPDAAHASLFYVSAFPTGRRYDGPRPDRRPSTCRRFGMGMGAAAGASSTDSSWEFVGSTRAYQPSVSPAFTLSCETGSRSFTWSFGAETAPFFFYRVPVDDGGADKKLHHAGSVSFGPLVGGDVLRAGPFVIAGVFTLGAGARTVFTPIRTREGVRHGLELRANTLFFSPGAFQAMALWHLWFDPRADEAP